MKKVWKVTHAGKSPEKAKISIALSSNSSAGLLLKRGEFVLCMDQMTAALDSQHKRGFVKIEEFPTNFALMGLRLGEAYSVEILNKPEPTIQEQTIVHEPEQTEGIPVDKLEEAHTKATEYINKN
jgi:hypothetical protein